MKTFRSQNLVHVSGEIFRMQLEIFQERTKGTLTLIYYWEVKEICLFSLSSHLPLPQNEENVIVEE